MSEHESQQEEEQQVVEVEEDFGLERVVVSPETLAKGLSNIKKTAGNLDLLLL